MTDLEIAEGLKRGEPGAFRALYSAIGPSLYTYLFRIVNRRELAEELTQEAFLTVIRKIAFFKPGHEGGIRAWTFRIATHLAIDVLRKEKRIDFVETPETPIENPDSETTPQSELERFQFQAAFTQAVRALTASQRMIFLLREQEELSSMEISRICGCSENAVKQTLFRARAALKRHLCE